MTPTNQETVFIETISETVNADESKVMKSPSRRIKKRARTTVVSSKNSLGPEIIA